MSSPDGVEVQVRGIGTGGVGIADLPDGRVLFLPRAAPGDRVRVRVVQEKERWARGEILAVLEGGEGRRNAPCPRYEECDGCSLQHLEYAHQADWKRRIVGDALRRIGGLEVEDPDLEPAPDEFGYRNKATMTLRRLGRGRVVAGFRERSARGRILDLGSECLLLAPGLARLWDGLRSGWGSGADLLPEGRQLRLSLRFLDGQGALLIHGGRGDGRPAELAEAVPDLTSIWRSDGDRGARHLSGQEGLDVLWLGEPLRLTGGAFFQVNRPVGEALHRFLLDEIGEVRGLRILEGYCGAGAVGRALARRGGEVIGIESDPQAVAEAGRDAPEGFVATRGKVEDLLADRLPAAVVILNPPRTGLDPRVPEALVDRPAGRVFYVSCDPATLARDLARLRGSYRVTGLRSFDLFPQTSHVETVATLEATGRE